MLESAHMENLLSRISYIVPKDTDDSEFDMDMDATAKTQIELK